MGGSNNGKFTYGISLVVVLLIGCNLRSPITSVSPILPDIKAAMELSTLQASLLTSIPLFIFAGTSILISRASLKIQSRYLLLISTVVLLVGLYIRIYGLPSTLFVGSILIGFGICIGNVTASAYIKSVFPSQIGLMTGLFSVSMNLMAAIASALSIQIGEWTGAGWQGSLGI